MEPGPGLVEEPQRPGQKANGGSGPRRRRLPGRVEIAGGDRPGGGRQEPREEERQDIAMDAVRHETSFFDLPKIYRCFKGLPAAPDRPDPPSVEAEEGGVA
jgi:hypothetical protein